MQILFLDFLDSSWADKIQGSTVPAGIYAYFFFSCLNLCVQTRVIESSPVCGWEKWQPDGWMDINPSIFSYGNMVLYKSIDSEHLLSLYI